MLDETLIIRSTLNPSQAPRPWLNKSLKIIQEPYQTLALTIRDSFKSQSGKKLNNR